MAPKQERVLGRLLLAAVALLLVDVDLDLLNLEEQEDNDQVGVLLPELGWDQIHGRHFHGVVAQVCFTGVPFESGVKFLPIGRLSTSAYV